MKDDATKTALPMPDTSSVPSIHGAPTLDIRVEGATPIAAMGDPSRAAITGSLEISTLLTMASIGDRPDDSATSSTSADRMREAIDRTLSAVARWNVSL